MLQVWLDKKNGTVWDMSTLVTSAVWKTSRIGKAGCLDLTFVRSALYQSKDFTFENGDNLRVSKEGVDFFNGYVFTIDRSADDTVRLLAYDQLRYLMANESYVFRDVTAADVVRRIADDFGLKTGALAASRHRIPLLLQDNKKLMDMIVRALDLTLIADKKIYVLYDDFGALTLRDAEEMIFDLSIGEGSGMLGYSHSASIDSETYNRIKLVQNNKSNGRRDVYIAYDSNAIDRWGRLQLYQVADEGMNRAQLEELAVQLLRYRNRESKTLKADALGDIRVRAGGYVKLRVDALGIDERMLVQECSHEFRGDEHIMKLDLKVVD
ncbi:hypothetical protein [Paenibacillus sp.]|uniref:XkdQ/YqbQ family protein n=1 Tax=Paenibacillus sp. TaxID=58172 RepID=UPI002811D373|nr:hypothetical protein [Paenibacillus sp.]